MTVDAQLDGPTLRRPHPERRAVRMKACTEGIHTVQSIWNALSVRTRPPHPSSDGRQSRPLAAWKRLAQRGRLRVLPPAARSGAPPRGRRHLAEMDGQHLARARRAARVSRIPERARVLLRER